MNYKESYTAYILSTKPTSKSAYVRAIEILSEITKREFFEEDNLSILEELRKDLLENQTKTNGKYFYKDATSYGKKRHYSAAIKSYIDFLEQYNNNGDIKNAQAHSESTIENKELQLQNISEFFKEEEAKLNKAKSLGTRERLKILNGSTKKPAQTIVKQTVFQRNPYVVVEVLHRAKGYCEKCKKPAPFLRDNDNTPYLEVHHIITLAEGGDDTVENAIALCPNCHRQAHYGKKNAI